MALRLSWFTILRRWEKSFVEAIEAANAVMPSPVAAIAAAVGRFEGAKSFSQTTSSCYVHSPLMSYQCRAATTRARIRS